MKQYEAKLDDEDAAKLLHEVIEANMPTKARVVGLAPVLEAADEDAYERLVQDATGHVDIVISLDGDDADDVEALLPGVQRLVVAADDPVYVRYDDGTTFFRAQEDVAERFSAEEATDAGDRGVVRELEADAEADEAMEDR